MSKTSDAYAQGYAAYPTTNNPYEENSPEGQDWVEGFNDAKNDDSEDDEDVEEWDGIEDDSDGDYAEEEEDDDDTDEDE